MFEAINVCQGTLSCSGVKLKNAPTVVYAKVKEFGGIVGVLILGTHDVPLNVNGLENSRVGDACRF